MCALSRSTSFSLLWTFVLPRRFRRGSLVGCDLGLVSATGTLPVVLQSLRQRFPSIRGNMTFLRSDADAGRFFHLVQHSSCSSSSSFIPRLSGTLILPNTHTHTRAHYMRVRMYRTAVVTTLTTPRRLTHSAPEAHPHPHRRPGPFRRNT